MSKKPTLQDFVLLPFRVAYKIYYMMVFVLSLTLLYPVFRYYLATPERYPKAFASMRLWAHLLNVMGMIRLKVEGRNNIPNQGAYIICPNHSSFLDITGLYSIFKNYFVFTGKKEIEKWPLFHIFYTSGMNILVDRENKSDAIRVFKRVSAEINRGLPLIMFPEGTISKRVPKLTTFKSGLFSIAIQKQVPILPVTFITNWERLQRGNFFWGKASPGISEVIIHEPIETIGRSKDEMLSLENRVRSVIYEPLKKRYGLSDE